MSRPPTVGRLLAALAAAWTLAAGAQPASRAEDAVLARGLDLPSTVEPAEAQRISALLAAGGQPGAAPIVIDYPLPGSVFPPDMVAPRFLWHDPAPGVALWLVDVALRDGRAHLSLLTDGAAAPGGEIDPRALGPTNEVYRPTPYQASARSWQPSDAVWKVIRETSVAQPAVVTILGVQPGAAGAGPAAGR
ncbi:MAG: hypothetical protein ACM3PV_03480 [Betaproteobacteria bacterium]